jgi:hypothetical protein
MIDDARNHEREKKTKFSVRLIFIDPSNNVYEILNSQKVDEMALAEVFLTCIVNFMVC